MALGHVGHVERELQPIPGLDIDISRLIQIPIKLADYTQPKRFRFIDCDYLLHKDKLRLWETTELPTGRYATISYVWQGLPPTTDEQTLSFTFASAGNASRFQVDVLKSACGLALHKGVNLIWLDGLCILQTSDEDQGWQIQNMYDVYSRCHHCVVLPAGMTRLATLEVTNTWIGRNWTLQEAVAPKTTYVLFAWTHGTCYFDGTSLGWVFELETGRSGYIELTQLLGARNKQLDFKQRVATTGLQEDRAEVIWRGTFAKFFPLHGPTTELKAAMQGLSTFEASNALWKSSFMRQCSFPADAVYSVMSMFGVNLDPLQFKGMKHERLAATVRIMQAITARGDRAQWLTLIRLAPMGILDERMCTVPKMVELHNLQERSEEWEKVSNYDVLLSDAPRGRVDDQGYLNISTKARPISPGEVLHGVGPDRNGTYVEDHQPDENEFGGLWAAYIGQLKQYGSGGVRWLYRNPVELLVLQQHAPGKWLVKYPIEGPDMAIVDGWETKEFAIGGPRPVEGLFEGAVVSC